MCPDGKSVTLWTTISPTFIRMTSLTNFSDGIKKSEILFTLCLVLVGEASWMDNGPLFFQKINNGGWSGPLWQPTRVPVPLLCTRETHTRSISWYMTIIYKLYKMNCSNFRPTVGYMTHGTLVSSPWDHPNCFTSVQRFHVIEPSASICLPFSLLLKALIGHSGFPPPTSVPQLSGLS